MLAKKKKQRKKIMSQLDRSGSDLSSHNSQSSYEFSEGSETNEEPSYSGYLHGDGYYPEDQNMSQFVPVTEDIHSSSVIVDNSYFHQ